MHKIEAEFEIAGWDEGDRIDAPGDGPPRGRATVRKTFSGAVEGSSVAELLTCRGEEGEAYVALERVEAAVEGRSGTFVIQHGAARGGDADPISFGYIVPGSGTGELAGITGEAEFAHDDSGATLRLYYSLPH